MAVKINEICVIHKHLKDICISKRKERKEKKLLIFAIFLSELLFQVVTGLPAIPKEENVKISEKGL